MAFFFKKRTVTLRIYFCIFKNAFENVCAKRELAAEINSRHLSFNRNRKTIERRLSGNGVNIPEKHCKITPNHLVEHAGPNLKPAEVN